ncbi:MAG TPA: hypothetical protein VGC74_16765 [Stenotrophomonas sp.]|jgi:hypothetical protein
MSPTPPQSTLLEIILATCVGATLGLLLDNLVLGTIVGIALGALLSVIKMRRGGGR